MSGLFLPAEGAVDAALRGFADTHAELVELSESPLYMTARQENPGRRVGIVSGGGSGHEPLHAGFLGAGMLDAVAPGRVFASPHNRQVYEASRAVAKPSGVLHVVKNYTGDRINFGIAAERLRQDGIEVGRVLVDDDLATDGGDTGTGRRGTAATVVVEKILGAAADGGAGLDELVELGARVAGASRSIAVASRAQTLPATGATAFELNGKELEYGVGIHGERAAQTVERPPFDELVTRMTGQVCDALDSPGQVVLLVNGLGSTTLLELYAICDRAAAVLRDRGVEVVTRLVGTLVPALDMAGFSITLTGLQPGWLEYLTAPTAAPAFPTLKAR